TITVHDPGRYEPPAGGTIVPVNLETGWPVAEAPITAAGGPPPPCRLIIDTGVRFTVALFPPIRDRPGPHDSTRSLHDLVIRGGRGGASRGDVARLDALTIGSLWYAKPVGIFSRDTSGIFAVDGPDGIVGGELLRHHRVTFDYPHQRLVFEPYSG